MTATYPAIYNMFGRRYADLTTSTVRLADNTIRIRHVKASIVEIEFSLQMVGL
jgi:hypothetical protein